MRTPGVLIFDTENPKTDAANTKHGGIRFERLDLTGQVMAVALVSGGVFGVKCNYPDD